MNIENHHVSSGLSVVSNATKLLWKVKVQKSVILCKTFNCCGRNMKEYNELKLIIDSTARCPLST